MARSSNGRRRWLALLLFVQVGAAWVGARCQGRCRPPSLRSAFEPGIELPTEDVVGDVLALLGNSISWFYVIFLLAALTLAAGVGQLFQKDDEIPGVRPGMGDRAAAQALLRAELEEGVEIVEDEGDEFRQEVAEAEKLGTDVKLPLPAWLAELEGEGFDLDLTVYDSLIESAARSGDFALAECWFREALKRDFQPQGQTFETLARGAANAGDLATAERWLERAENAGRAPEKATFLAFIESAAEKGDLSAAELWLARAQAANVSPDAAILTALRTAALKKSDASEAREELPEDVEILGVDGYSELGGLRREPKQGAGPGARAYLEMLKVTDLELDPSTGSDMLISACRTGDLEAAEFWLNKCRALKLQPSEQAYRALVDLAARKSTRQTAERLAAEAEKAQLALGPSYSSLAVAACEEGDLPSAVAWLRRGKPRTAALNQVLKLAIDRGDLALAEQCFGEAVAGGTKPDATTFRSFTSACAAAGELEAAEAWVRRCRAEGLQPDKGSFNSLVRGCVKRGDHLAAGRWYKKAEEQGFEPSVALLGSVLRCAAFKDLAFARQMLDYVLGRGTVPDVQTFNSLVSAAQQAKDPKAAEGFLNLAVQHGVRPEVSAFDALIALSAEAADLPQAEKWLARMGKVGLRPSQASFAGLVDAAARMGDLSMAVYWYEEALKVGIQMDGQTYANLVLAAELQGDDAEAKKWFRLACQRQATIKASFVEKLLSILMDRGEMAVARNWLKRAREAGIDCNGDTLCGLFRELMRTQNFKAAEEWFEHTQEVGIELTEPVFLEVINSFAISGDWKGAERWYRRGIQAEYRLADLKFDRLIILSARGNDYGAAKSWCECCLASGQQPDAMAYVALVHGAVEAGHAEAEEWFQGAVDSGLTPTVNLYTPLVRRFAQDGNMEKAEAWFHRILEAGLKPGIFPYTSLVSGWLHLAELPRAESWLRKSREAGLQSDAVMYSALIDGYCKEGSESSLQRAQQLLEEMAAAKLAKPRPFSKLLRAHAQRGDLEKATLCADLMESLKLKVRKPEYTQLLQACARSTHPERREVAARLLRQMSADGLSPDEATLQMLQPLRPARPRGADSSEKAGQASASASTLAEMLHSAGAKKRHRETGETETAKVLQELVEELGD